MKYLSIFYLFLIAACSTEPQLTAKREHPTDSLLALTKLETEIWEFQPADSSSALNGDSIMLYRNGIKAQIIPIVNGKRHGEAVMYDSLENWLMSWTYYENWLTGEIRCVYPETGLIKYSYQLYGGVQVGEFLNFYDHYHDSAFWKGYIVPVSTHMKEYRFYDKYGRRQFRRTYGKDQTIKLDSGNTISVYTKEDFHYVDQDVTVSIWAAEPHNCTTKSYIRDNQTGEIEHLNITSGEASFSFVPKIVEPYRFTIFNEITDSISNHLRIDSLTYRVGITKM